MNSTEKLRQADLRRRRAMIGADTKALDEVLSEDLVWTHSSGDSQTKAEFIEAIDGGGVVYLELEVSKDRIVEAGDTLVHQGVLKGRASRDKKEKQLAAKFLAVWQCMGDEPRLLAWQSTNMK